MAEQHTQKAMGRGQLLSRLTAQLDGNKGFAIALLKKRGDMLGSGELSAQGESRNQMTASERAKDRAAERTGRPASSFDYDPNTNSTSST
tara:strand:- start:216 stop:485 length:270 start_codon:yes stop_codon:yes gene_type:complete